MRIIAVLILITLAVLFVVSFFRPARSRRIQEWIKHLTERYADKASDKGGDAGDKAADWIEKISRASQSVEHGGRRAHDVVFRSNAGAEQERKLQREHGAGAERGKD